MAVSAFNGSELLACAVLPRLRSTPPRTCATRHAYVLKGGGCGVSALVFFQPVASSSALLSPLSFWCCGLHAGLISVLMLMPLLGSAVVALGVMLARSSWRRERRQHGCAGFDAHQELPNAGAGSKQRLARL